MTESAIDAARFNLFLREAIFGCGMDMGSTILARSCREGELDLDENYNGARS